MRSERDVLTDYSSGVLSARRAALQLGGSASEHDLFVKMLAAGLSLPLPPARRLAEEIEAGIDMFKRLGNEPRQDADKGQD